MTWREAFLRQSASDFAVMDRLLSPSDVPDAHRLHYLQMATEKLAKSLAAPLAGGPPALSHTGFSHFLRYELPAMQLHRPLGFGRREDLERTVRAIWPLVEKIEKLAPKLAGAGNPNAEYPWQDQLTGQIVAPVDHCFLSAAEQVKLDKLVGVLRNLLRLLTKGT